MPRSPAYKRAALGLLGGLIVGVGLQFLLLGGALRRVGESVFARQGVLALNAAVELVDRAGEDATRLSAALTALAAGRADLQSARVIAGAQLLASTHPDDVGGKAAPRRLRPEEKALFDQGQRLRAAVETNRDEGTARKLEIETERNPDGTLTLAAPFERAGQVAGFVQVKSATRRADKGAPVSSALLFAVVPLAVLLAAGRFLEGRPRWLLLAGAILLLAAMIGYGSVSARRVAEEERRFAEQLAASAGRMSEATRAAIAGAGLPAEPAPNAGLWDQDAYRRPIGFLQTDGMPDPTQVAEGVRDSARVAWRASIWAWVLGLTLLLFIGQGAAGRAFALFRRYRHAYAYAAPALIGMLVLVFFPFLYGIILSFTDANIYNSNQALTEIWRGLRNFADILGNFQITKETPAGSVVDYQNFYWTLGFTVVWTVSNVALGVTVGLFLALILNTKGFALRPIYRVLLILPWAMPNYITALIWKGMFHQQFGVVNQLIQVFGGQPVAWFERVGTSFVTVLATNGWLSFPFMMVISLGALQSIPGELYEAARVDGATRRQQFFAITLPSLKPTLVPAIILSVIWTFNMFNVIYLVSGGEPARGTELLITQAYKIAFEQYRYGYAAAYSTVIFLILLVYGLWQNKVTRATEGI